jgi:hypothetical protein
MLPAVSAPAQTLAESATSPQTGAIFYTENDDWWPDTGTDKNYTNGFRLTINRNADIFRLNRLPLFRWVPRHRGCHEAAGEQTCISTAVHFGQQFYTPDDITISELIPRDRPYAGWLYIGGSWQAASDRKAVNTDLFVGFTGGPSLARQVQTQWHKVVGASVPRGWDNQIGDRLGLVLAHSRHRVVAEKGSTGHRWFELTPFIGGNAGNIMTDAYAGARAKVGVNITRDWTHSAIGPEAARRQAPRDTFEIFLSADARGRLVAYDAFIDAAKRHDLNRRIGVADGGVGVGLRIASFMVTYRVAFISREYDEAPTRHEFKALRFMYLIR